MAVSERTRETVTEAARFKESLALLDRVLTRIPCAAQTLSKNYTQYPLGSAPIFAARADKCYVWDVDGNRFVDYVMGLGAVLLGHNQERVRNAVLEQLSNGQSFSLPHRAELELAERLQEFVPNAEMTRFAKNGSDVTAAAVRLARAFTGRELVAACGYHGWHDWSIGATSRNAGVPTVVREQTLVFRYNDLGSLEQILTAHTGQVACVILEPMGVEYPVPGFLEGVADLARKHGAVLVFDECWTGFRLARGGAQEFFGVECDLNCFGKGLGNGFAVSALSGRRAIMETLEHVFFSLTFGGELIGITAALAVLGVLDSEPVIQHVSRIGTKLRDGTEALIRATGLEKHIRIQGAPPRHAFLFLDDAGNDWLELKSLVIEEAIARGILFAGYHVLSYAHDDEVVDLTLRAYEDVFAVVADAVRHRTVASKLRGQAVRPVFRRL